MGKRYIYIEEDRKDRLVRGVKRLIMGFTRKGREEKLMHGILSINAFHGIFAHVCSLHLCPESINPPTQL